MNKDTKDPIGKINSVYGDYVRSGIDQGQARLLATLSEAIRIGDVETRTRILRELRTRHPQATNTSPKSQSNNHDELWPENLEIFPAFYDDFMAGGWKACDIEILAVCLKMVLAGDTRARTLWIEEGLPTKWIG